MKWEQQSLDLDDVVEVTTTIEQPDTDVLAVVEALEALDDIKRRKLYRAAGYDTYIAYIDARFPQLRTLGIAP
jgi:hypothetical protein